MRRLKLNWTIDEAFGLKEKQNYKGPKSLTVDGETFDSFKKAAEFYGISLAVAQLRKNKGWQLNEIFKTPVKSSRQIVSIDGVSFVSISEAARAFGFKPKQVQHRIEKGWSLERALKTKLKSS